MIFKECAFLIECYVFSIAKWLPNLPSDPSVPGLILGATNYLQSFDETDSYQEQCVAQSEDCAIEQNS